MYRFLFFTLFVSTFCFSSVSYASGIDSARRKVEAKLIDVQHHVRRATLADSIEVQQAMKDFVRILPVAGFTAAKRAALNSVAGDAKAETRVIEHLQGVLPLVEAVEKESIRYQQLYQKQLLKQRQAALKRQQKMMRKSCPKGQSSGRSGNRGSRSRNSPLQQLQRSGKQFDQYLKRNAQAYQRLLQGRR